MRDLPKRMMDATQDVARLVTLVEEIRHLAGREPQTFYARSLPKATTCGLIVAAIDETLGENRG